MQRPPAEERLARSTGALTRAPALPGFDPDDSEEATGAQEQAAEGLSDLTTGAQVQ
jgi:hypothetical protein